MTAQVEPGDASDGTPDAAAIASPEAPSETGESAMMMEDDEPLRDVPPLPKRNGSKTARQAHRAGRPNIAKT